VSESFNDDGGGIYFQRDFGGKLNSPLMNAHLGYIILNRGNKGGAIYASNELTNGVSHGVHSNT
jgi:predicted outer membrane repeat protein